MASLKRSSGTVSEMRKKPSPLGSIGGAGGHHDAGLLEHQLAVGSGAVPVGNGRPDVDGPLRGRHVHADLLQHAAHQVAAALVDRAHLLGRPRVQGGCGGQLYCLEDAGVDVRLQLPIGLYGGPVAHDRRRTPARHVPALRQREHFDAHVLGAWGLQEARRHIAVERGLRVRGVVHDQHIVLAAERNGLLEEAVGDDRPGRVVGVVQVQEPRPLAVAGRDRFRSGAKPRSGSSGIATRLAAGQVAGRPCRPDSRGRPQAQPSRDRGRPG